MEMCEGVGTSFNINRTYKESCGKSGLLFGKLVHRKYDIQG